MILIPLLIVGLGGAAWLVTVVVHGQPGNHLMHFVAERAASGVSPEAMGREMRLRMGAARLRRTASHAVVRDPRNYTDTIRKLAKAEAMRIAAVDKQMAKQFVRWAENAELAEILYPAAMKVVYLQARKQRPIHHETHHDLHAALRVGD